MRQFVMLSLMIIFVLTACSANRTSGENSYMQDIYQDYPELIGHDYSVERVKRVIDGDTFETFSGNKVRLIGVNTPESIGKADFYGREASRYSRDRLQDKTVYLFADVGDKDKYGRVLRYVFIDNESIMYNESLLVEGYANVMTVPPNVLYAEKFVQSAREARENNRGLWSSNRKSKTNYKPKCADPKIKGNINANNDRIYHLPGDRHYEETKAEALFCTEAEAKSAGFRRTKQ